MKDLRRTHCTSTLSPEVRIPAGKPLKRRTNNRLFLNTQRKGSKQGNDEMITADKRKFLTKTQKGLTTLAALFTLLIISYMLDICPTLSTEVNLKKSRQVPQANISTPFF